MDQQELQGPARPSPPWRDQLIWSVGLTLAGIALGLVLWLKRGTANEQLLAVTELLTSIGQFLAMHLLWKYGTFRNSGWRRMAMASFSVVIIGASFKIQHWPGADLLTPAGLSGVLVSYLAHYSKKDPKRWSDHLKAAWLIAAFAGAIIHFLHLSPFATEISLVSVPLFWTALIAFVRERSFAFR